MGESQHQVTVKKHFNALAPIYDAKAENRKNYLQGIDQIIIQYLKKKEQKNQRPLVILDVGCGSGTRAANIAAHLRSPHVWGIDIAEQMINQARKRIDYASMQNMTSFSLPVKYDAIFCLFNSFGYLGTYKERFQALRRMYDHLKYDGTLFIDVMNIFHKGEGSAFKRKNRDILKDILFPLIHPRMGVGNKEFSIKINNKDIKGFVHGFFDTEMKWLLKKSRWITEQKYIIGYDSGKIQQQNSEGQLFYICKKNDTTRKTLFWA